MEVRSYVWNLLQAIFEAEWSHFKVSSQPDTSTLVKAIRNIYGSNSVSTFSPDIEMVVDIPEAKVTFTLVSKKKYKGKRKPFFLPFIYSSDYMSKTLLIL